MFKFEYRGWVHVVFHIYAVEAVIVPCDFSQIPFRTFKSQIAQFNWPFIVLHSLGRFVEVKNDPSRADLPGETW